MRCIVGCFPLSAALIFVICGCTQTYSFSDSGQGHLVLSKEGVLVDELISDASRNGKWYFHVQIDKETRFGALWNIIEDRWEIAESEWSVKCDAGNGSNGKGFVFTPGDECDRMYGTLLSCRYVDVEIEDDGWMRISEEANDFENLASAPVWVLFRCPRSAPVSKLIGVMKSVLSQYKYGVKAFVKPIDLPVHGECAAPWVNPRERDSSPGFGLP